MEGIIEWNLEDRQFMLWSAVLSLASLLVKMRHPETLPILTS